MHTDAINDPESILVVYLTDILYYVDKLFRDAFYKVNI
jgi:hypothetical protein